MTGSELAGAAPVGLLAGFEFELFGTAVPLVAALPPRSPSSSVSLSLGAKSPVCGSLLVRYAAVMDVIVGPTGMRRNGFTNLGSAAFLAADASGEAGALPGWELSSGIGSSAEGAGSAVPCRVIPFWVKEPLGLLSRLLELPVRRLPEELEFGRGQGPGLGRVAFLVATSLGIVVIAMGGRQVSLRPLEAERIPQLALSE